MTDCKGLKVQEAVEWCGSGVQGAGGDSATPPGARPAGAATDEGATVSAAGLEARRDGGRPSTNDQQEGHVEDPVDGTR